MDEQAPVGPWVLVAIGASAGLLGGFFGVGGGIILVPLLIAAGFQRHRAHATSLAAFVLTAVAGALSFGLAGQIDVGAGVTIGIGGIVGSIVGATVMNRISSRALGIIFGVVLLTAGLRLILSGDPLPEAGELDPFGLILTAVAIGLVSGLFAGLAGIGGGVVIVPSTVLLLGLDQHTAQGTSLLAIFFTAVAGSMVNLRNRRVRPVDGLFVGAGGVAGALVGSQIALGIDGRTLSIVFGFLVLFVSLRSLYEALRPRAGHSSEVSSES